MSILVNYATKIEYSDGITEIKENGGEWEQALSKKVQEVIDGKITLSNFKTIVFAFNSKSAVQYDFSELIDEIKTDIRLSTEASIDRNFHRPNYSQLWYRHKACRNELLDNKFQYMNQIIRNNKRVCGIGPHAIVLEDEGKKKFHNYIPSTKFCGPDNICDGIELAQELVAKYGEKNIHLHYISTKYINSLVDDDLYNKEVTKKEWEKYHKREFSL